MNDETRTVAWAVLVFAAGFLLVYVLFFGVHGKALYKTDTKEIGGDGAVYMVTSTGTKTQTQTLLPPATTTPGGQQERATYQEMDPKMYQAYYGSAATGTQANGAVAARVEQSDRPEVVDGKTFYPVSDLFKDTSQNQEVRVQTQTEGQPVTIGGALEPGQVMLSNTYIWQSKKGPFKVLSLLGIAGMERYILKDVNNTHYIYLGDFSEDLRGNIQALGGNVVEIKDQTAIRNDILFGENVQLISLPQMPTKQFLLVRFLGGKDVRFIQADNDYFVANKRYIQEQFDFAYGR